ncbi:hypothetical protein T12_11038 [Trichinella patagoniensis]|uniref:Uncharacterized protein n=1 Tax=Trichinella patagoniensis TaxID=990121 RepID=A0A0V0Z3W9_9BILA|nr:hypothetical protein T12_11038 [Trichinella patagoniensis]
MVGKGYEVSVFDVAPNVPDRQVRTNLMSRAQVDMKNFQTMPDVIMGGRSGIEAARNLFNVRRPQHSAIRQRSQMLIAYYE